MKTKHITGDTTFNDNLNLPSGMVSIDSEKKSLRFYDGITVGGFEVLGRPAVTGPGPTELIAGDMSAGFFGEVDSTSFISGDVLAATVGLSAGTAHNNDTPWLKFSLDERVLYVPKTTLRYGMTRANLNTANLIYGQQTVTIGSDTFKVRLFKGLNIPQANSATSKSVSDPVESHGSEWNRLLYPLVSALPGSQVGPNWVEYTLTELGFAAGMNGRATITQETVSNVNYDVLRGSGDISSVHYGSFSGAPLGRGWRPVLELVV